MTVHNEARRDRHDIGEEGLDPLHGRKLRIGIISPYSFEIPGGVQFHIRDFAQELIARGHTVEVLAPGRRTRDMPLWVHTNDSSFSLPYNGSVAQLSYFGFVGMRTRMWVRQGHFDIVHLHEPEAPSLSHKPLAMLRHPPFIGTFHAAFDRYPLALRVFERYLHRYMSSLSQAIFVSPASQTTAQRYLPQGIETHIIPNGINRAEFFHAAPRRQWEGTHDAPTIGFLGRMGEPRKGFPVFVQAALRILEHYPKARFLCVGDGQSEGRKTIATLDAGGSLSRHVEFLGRISDEDKARFYRSLSVYVAPQTGGESFGIVLAEAMAAGCAVVASDLEAFSMVSDGGSAAKLFSNADPDRCAQAVCSLLADESKRKRLQQAGRERSREYDWHAVADKVLAVYARALS